MSLRAQAIEAARGALAAGLVTECNYLADRVGSYYDVAIRAGATEYLAAELAVVQFGSDLLEQWEARANDPYAALNEVSRAKRFVSAGYHARNAGARFRQAGELAVFERYCAIAEKAA